ncbi:MAG: hypothetical protein H7X93_09060, partial [Sphingomonadaceae bacterium]|nr:hypothetical protein [Sphingomonadaceae bacterium]
MSLDDELVSTLAWWRDAGVDTLADDAPRYWFAAAAVLFNADGSVKGVATGDMGVARDGTHKSDYTPGLEIHAKY